MKTIGEYLKDARNSLGKSKKDLSKITKIKKNFIDNIENEKWSGLPEYPVVAGFVKSIAKHLNLKEDSVVALLRRDYPPKEINPNPKPDIKEKFVLNPKLTFLSGILLAIVIVIGYVVIQYVNYIKPPKLNIDLPKDGQTLKLGIIKVVGTVDSDAVLTINNQPVLISESGDFIAEMEAGLETSELVAVAKSRAGKETKIIINIKVEEK